MNWSDERYVKLYTRQTATWRLWPWQARCVFPLMLQVADGAGLISADCEDPVDGVAALVMVPREVVEEAIRALTKSGTVSKVDGGFLIVKFIEAQEATKTERQKKRDQRENARAKARLHESCPELSPAVPQCPPPTQPSLAQPSLKETTTLSAAPTAGEADAPSAPVAQPPAEEPPPKTPLSAQVREVFDFWRETLGHATSKLDGKREHAITSRLKAGFSVDDLKQAILGCSLTPHNMGQNDKGQRYDDIELICRNASNTERFMANATNPPSPKAQAPPGRTRNPDLIVGRSTAPPPPPRPPEPDFGF